VCAPVQAGTEQWNRRERVDAWDATFRSRLYLSAPKSDQDSIPDPDARLIERKKANYAIREAGIKLRWKEGVLVTAEHTSVFLAAVESQDAERVFLDLLEAFTAAGRPVSDNSRAGNYAPKAISRRPDREGYRQADFVRAMERLFVRHLIRVAEYGRKGDIRKQIVRCTALEGTAYAAE
jgi:hypothetical protein